jgi:hypothetical protein
VSTSARGVLGGLLLFFALLLFVEPAGARTIDRKALKQGMTLPEVVQVLGQPDTMQWMSSNGQAVLVVFFETDSSGIRSLFPFVGDTVKGEDGRMFLPLGFVHEGLVGWGRKYYKQLQQPQ